MAKIMTEYTLSSTARMLISMSPLATLYQGRKQPSADLSKLSLIGPEAANEGMKNPRIRQDTRTYADMITQRRHIEALRMAADQLAFASSDILKNLETKNKSASTDLQTTIRQSTENLATQRQRITQMQESLETNYTQHVRLYNKLLHLVNEESGQEQLSRQEAANKLIQEIETMGLDLSEIEKTELARLDSYQDLLKRYTELNLKLPKQIDPSARKAADYFYLKGNLACHDSLLRRMQTADTKTLTAQMKKLKQPLASIEKSIANLNKQQATQHQQLHSEQQVVTKDIKKLEQEINKASQLVDDERNKWEAIEQKAYTKELESMATKRIARLQASEKDAHGKDKGNEGYEAPELE